MKFEDLKEFVYLEARVSSLCEEEKEFDVIVSKDRYDETMNHFLKNEQLLMSTKYIIYYDNT